MTAVLTPSSLPFVLPRRVFFGSHSRVLTLDDCNRPAFAIAVVAPSLPATGVIRTRVQSIQGRGNPKIMRCDPGLASMCDRLRAWANDRLSDLRPIQPGQPQQKRLGGRR